MLLQQMGIGFFQCCQRSGADGNEFQVFLSSDAPAEPVKGRQQPHHIARADSFDITFTPRVGTVDSGAGVESSSPAPASSPLMTPRQQDLKDRLELPTLHQYPVPPSCQPSDSEEARWAKLLDTYQQFVLDLHTGMYLTQLTSNKDYSDIHCQLMEDLETLKLDQSNGRIVEFPLTGVSKVYRIVKNDDKWYSAGSLTGPAPVPPLPLSNAEHIVVVEFMRRKLAFVFKEMADSQRFLMCMELLIRRAQQQRAGKPLRAVLPNSSRGKENGSTPRKDNGSRCRLGDSIVGFVDTADGFQGRKSLENFFSPRGWCKESPRPAR